MARRPNSIHTYFSNKAKEEESDNDGTDGQSSGSGQDDGQRTSSSGDYYENEDGPAGTSDDTGTPTSSISRDRPNPTGADDKGSSPLESAAEAYGSVTRAREDPTINDDQGVEAQDGFEHRQQARELEQRVIEEAGLDSEDQVAIQFNEEQDRLEAELTKTGEFYLADQAKSSISRDRSDPTGNDDDPSDPGGTSEMFGTANSSISRNRSDPTRNDDNPSDPGGTSDVFGTANSSISRQRETPTAQGVEEDDFGYSEQARELEQRVIEDAGLENGDQVAIHYDAEQNRLEAELTGAGESYLAEQAQSSQSEEQFGDIPIVNPLTGNRVEEDLENASEAYQDGADSWADLNQQYGVPAAIGAIEDQLPSPLEDAIDIDNDGQGAGEDFAQNLIEGSVGALNPADFALGLKEIGESVVTQPSRIGGAAVEGAIDTERFILGGSSTGTAGPVEDIATELFGDGVTENQFSEDVGQRAGVIAESTADSVRTDPVGATGKFVGGLAVGVATGTAAGRVARAATGGRVGGSDLFGRAIQGTADRVRQNDFLDDNRGQLDLTGPADDVEVLTADDLDVSGRSPDPVPGSRPRADEPGDVGAGDAYQRRRERAREEESEYGYDVADNDRPWLGREGSSRIFQQDTTETNFDFNTPGDDLRAVANVERRLEDGLDRGRPRFTRTLFETEDLDELFSPTAGTGAGAGAVAASDSLSDAFAREDDAAAQSMLAGGGLLNDAGASTDWFGDLDTPTDTDLFGDTDVFAGPGLRGDTWTPTDTRTPTDTWTPTDTRTPANPESPYPRYPDPDGSRHDPPFDIFGEGEEESANRGGADLFGVNDVEFVLDESGSQFDDMNVFE